MEMVSLVPQARLLVSFCLIIILISCNNTFDKSVNSLSIDKNKQIITYNNGELLVNGKVFTGQLFTIFQNTSDTSTIENYQNGLEDGVWKKYFPNKLTQEIRYFNKGKKVGIYETWWPNGKPQLQYFFYNDEYEGTCKEWSENGLLVKIMNYQKGHEQGEQKWWYENGKIKANYVIKEGRRFGLLGTKNCINVADSIFAD